MAGPLFRARVQMATAAALRQRGFGFVEARRLAATVDADTISLAASMAPEEVQSAVGSLGDGTILQMILEFLQSELGNALIQLIISLLIGV